MDTHDCPQDQIVTSLARKLRQGPVTVKLPWTLARRRSVDRDVLEAWTLVMGREAALLWLSDRARLA